MKKAMAVLLVLVMGFAFMPAISYAASGVAEDSIMDKAGDWFATLGKSDSEKDQILAERRMDRVTKRAGKAMNKLGKDMQNAFK